MKIVYVPPVYESIQHEATLLSSDNQVLECSLHTDISLLMRIDSLKSDATTINFLKQSMQPMIDNSNFKQQFEDSFGKLTDTQLIESCPSRYIQTRSEQMQYLKELSEKDKTAREEYSKSLKDKEEKARVDQESADFRKRIELLFK